MKIQIKGYTLQVDDNFGLVLQDYKIYLSKALGYAQVRLKGKVEYVHHLAFDYANPNVRNGDREFSIDHINGDRLDNRSCNLQYISQSANTAKGKSSIKKQTSLIKGVSYCKRFNVWKASINRRDGKKVSANFTTEFEAACGWDYLFRLTYPKVAFIPNIWHVNWDSDTFNKLKLSNLSGNAKLYKEGVWFSPERVRKDTGKIVYILNFRGESGTKRIKTQNKSEAAKWYQMFLESSPTTN